MTVMTGAWLPGPPERMMVGQVPCGVCPMISLARGRARAGVRVRVGVGVGTGVGVRVKARVRVRG